MSFRWRRMAHAAGVYRAARWANRQVRNRDELRQERSDKAFYAQFISEGDLVFDVGGNYGQKARVFLQLGARVVAFEPQPDCRAELERRCGSRHRLHVLGTALGAQEGDAMLYVRTHRGASGMLPEWASHYAGIEDKIKVPVTTLDQAISEFGRPSFIKIDVEGYELEVLKGLSQGIPIVQLEFHLTDHRHRRNDADIEKTIGCLERLAEFAEIEMNLTPAELPVFAFPSWLPMKEFRQRFRALDPQAFGDLFPNVSRPQSYGDVFARWRRP